MSTEQAPEYDVVENAGAGTDQHVTGHPERGESLVDQPPVSTTPAHGSSNKGVNTTRANRVDRSAEPRS
jgi:hypothetical protein